MSFEAQIIKKRAREWEVTEQEVREIAERMLKFIRKEGKGNITPILLLKSFFVLEKVKKEKYNNNAKALALQKNKNIIIEKYVDEIIDLHFFKDLGCRRIAKYLKEKHNAKIHYSTIYKFLKNYKEAQNG